MIPGRWQIIIKYKIKRHQHLYLFNSHNLSYFTFCSSHLSIHHMIILTDIVDSKWSVSPASILNKPPPSLGEFTETIKKFLKSSSPLVLPNINFPQLKWKSLLLSLSSQSMVISYCSWLDQFNVSSWKPHICLLRYFSLSFSPSVWLSSEPTAQSALHTRVVFLPPLLLYFHHKFEI